MKKKSTTLIIAFVLLILAVILYVVVQKAGPKDEEEKTDYLMTEDSSDIYKYSYTYDGDTLSFTYDEDEGWSYDKDKDFAVDAEQISGLLEYLWGTSVTRTLEDVKESSLAEYGLDKPSAEISYKMKDGTSGTFHIGNTNDTTGDVYMYRDDDTSKVYLVSSSINQASTDLETLRDTDAEAAAEASDAADGE